MKFYRLTLSITHPLANMKHFQKGFFTESQILKQRQHPPKKKLQPDVDAVLSHHTNPMQLLSISSLEEWRVQQSNGHKRQ